MLRSILNNFLQNKNVVMFVTALIFMSGILGFFNDNALIVAFVLSVIFIILIIKNLISVKYIFLWVFIFYFGFFNAYFRIKSTDALVPYTNNNVSIKGQIVSIPNSGDKQRIKFFFKVYEVNKEQVSGKTLVAIATKDIDFSAFQIGDYYEMEGRLKAPFKAGNPSQFDYGKYLKNFGAYSVFYADNCKSIERKLSYKWQFLQNLNDLRDKIIKVHSKYLVSPELEILGGIVFGDDAVAPPDYIKASFVNSGLLHILAASGMNVAFIYGFWFFFMKRLRVPFKLSVISGMVLVVLYTLMTGLGASVIRAAMMLLFVLAGKLIDRDAHSVSLLSFVAMLMLLYNPAFINDVGFQLSFIVTFGLLTTANVIFEKFKDSKLLNFILGYLLIPVIAQVWVAPIQMFYFNTFSTYSIFANILSVPFLGVVSFGGFISSIIAIFTPLTDKICCILDYVMNYALQAIVYISNYFAGLDNSLYTTTHPSVLQIFLYYTIVLLLTLSLKIGINKKIIISVLSCVFTIVILSINIPSKNLEIIAFDVQNADCFLIKTPKNKYFIIDTGRAAFRGGKAQANSIIIKYLKDRGIRDIEGLIVTHFDNDHSGGTVDIMKNVNVKHFYINSFESKTMISYEIFKTYREKHIPTVIPKGIIYEEPDLKVSTFINPEGYDNDKSIITLLSYKDFDMLFMGDAGIKAFNFIKKDLKDDIEVLKVGHHGANNVVNQEMLNTMKTQVSVISTGPNAFGHPAKGTLDVLRNTQIYRTDRHNSIKIDSDGKAYSVYMYSPDKHKYIKSNSFIVRNL